MIRPHCNSQLGYVRLKFIVSISVAVAIALWLGVRWQPERVVRRQQAALVEALENRSDRKLKRVLAEHYRDQWDFDRNDAVITLLDVGSQFFVLGVTPLDPVSEFSDGMAVVSMRFELTGTGSPIAHEVIRRNNRLKEPFRFTWEKQSFWPGSWRLTRIENSDLPDELFGYEPGDISRNMSAAGF